MNIRKTMYLKEKGCYVFIDENIPEGRRHIGRANALGSYEDIGLTSASIEEMRKDYRRLLELENTIKTVVKMIK